MGLLLSLPAVAGYETGYVRFQHGQYNSSISSAGYTFFYLEGGTREDIPGCANFDSGERWVIDNNRPAAEMQMSILLAAALANKQVRVRGTRDCDAWGDTETARDVVLMN